MSKEWTNMGAAQGTKIQRKKSFAKIMIYRTIKLSVQMETVADFLHISAILHFQFDSQWM